MSLVSAAPSEYTAPGVEEFWQPIIGDGIWAITRPMFLVVLSTIIVVWFLLATMMVASRWARRSS